MGKALDVESVDARTGAGTPGAGPAAAPAGSLDAPAGSLDEPGSHDGTDGTDGTAEAASSASERAAGRDRDRWVFRGALALATLPFVVTALALIVGPGGDYLPAGDLAMTEMHIRDIGHHEVLTGLWSRYVWSHPGPMQFYLVAPFYWLSGGSSLGVVAGALAINLAAVLGCLAVARQRGGSPLVACTLVAFLLLVRSLGPEFLGDNWNLTITVLPFALLTFLAWSMLAGETWALPVGAFVASFLVQTHIGFLATAVPLLLVGAGALVVRARRRPGSPDERRLRHLARPALASLAVLAVVWLPPVLDRLMHKPSNLGNAYRYFRDPGEPGHPVSVGWRIATGQFAATGEWLTGKLPPNPMTGESPYMYGAPPPLLLLAAVVAFVAVWRLARQGWALVVTFGVSFALVVVSIMRTAGTVADYRLRYTWVPPVLAAVALLWALWLAAARRWPRAERALLPAALAAAVVLSGVTSISGARAGVPHEDDSEVVRTLAAPIIERFEDADRPLLFTDVIPMAGPWYSRGVVLQLERHGIEVQVPAGMRYAFTRSREHHGGPVEARLLMVSGDQVPEMLDEPGLELISRWATVTPARYDALRAERDELLEDFEEGRLDISDAEFQRRFIELSDKLRGDELRVTTADVAVFLDERPPE
ncbi:MAG TPA: hypothetical protein VFI47_01440 [Acidimicrobiales bacterium]|nr:hypothetical protein [Acidimicrobiales bacterium]